MTPSGTARRVKFQVAGYTNWFTDYIYIYETQTGLEINGLPVFQYRQSDAHYIGIEGEVSATLVHRGPFSLAGNVVVDYVRATLENRSAVPRSRPKRRPSPWSTPRSPGTRSAKSARPR